MIEHLHHDGGDLRMLAYTRGRQRELPEIEALAEPVGLRVRGVHRLTTFRAVIDLRLG